MRTATSGIHGRERTSDENACDAVAARSPEKQDERHRRIALRPIFRMIDVLVDRAARGGTRVADKLVGIGAIPH
jgi:hypothetical protein